MPKLSELSFLTAQLGESYVKLKIGTRVSRSKHGLASGLEFRVADSTVSPFTAADYVLAFSEMKCVFRFGVVALVAGLFSVSKEGAIISCVVASSSSSSEASDGTSAGALTADPEGFNGTPELETYKDPSLKELTFRVEDGESVESATKEPGAKRQWWLKKRVLLGVLAAVAIAFMLRTGTSVYQEVKELRDPVTFLRKVLRKYGWHEFADKDLSAEEQQELWHDILHADFLPRRPAVAEPAVEERERGFPSVASDIPSSSPGSEGPWGSWQSSERSSEEYPSFSRTGDAGLPHETLGSDDVFLEGGVEPTAPAWEPEPGEEPPSYSTAVEGDFPEITKPLERPVDYNVLADAAMPVADMLERVSTSLPQSLGAAISWLGDVQRVLEEGAVLRAEGMLAARELVSVLQSVRMWSRDEIPVIYNSFYRLSVELKQSIGAALAGDVSKADEALRALEEVGEEVELASRKHLVFLQMTQQMKRTCVAASTEAEAVFEKAARLATLSRRLSIRLDTNKMDSDPTAFEESLESERGLLDQMETLLQDSELPLLGRETVELLGQAAVAQRSFVSAARNFVRGIPPEGMPFSELREHVVEYKNAVLSAAQRMETMADILMTHATGVRAALRMLEPETDGSFYEASLRPLSLLADQMEKGVNQILQSLNVAENALGQ